MFRDLTIGTIWVGEVIDNNDKLKLGRIKIKIYGKYDTFPDSDIPWSIPYSQLTTGTLIIPNIGDLVNVFFENGDENIPFYVSTIKLNDSLLSEIDNDYPKVWSLNYDKIGDNALQIFYTDTQGLILRVNNSYIQFDNKDKSIIVNNGKKVIHVQDESISIGSINKSKEPAVLADTLEKILNDFITELGKISGIATPAGPSGPINGSPLWTPLVTKFKTDFVTFKSKIVNLD
jgi:hypothetical protein